MGMCSMMGGFTLVTILSPKNVKFELKDPNLVYWSDI
jgi:hypothetical protein